MIRRERVSTNEFIRVIARLKALGGWHRDNEVAQALGITPENLAAQKRLNTLPLEKIVVLCRRRKWSLDPVFEGVFEEAA
ncbi:MAG: hypothetical protein LBU73_07995 [Helicobacteraceae bacterium]|jgi:hypothetical protein|nr:hypothetical protein [Helicobacteraceae bacterium]